MSVPIRRETKPVRAAFVLRNVRLSNERNEEMNFCHRLVENTMDFFSWEMFLCPSRIVQIFTFAKFGRTLCSDNRWINSVINSLLPPPSYCVISVQPIGQLLTSSRTFEPMEKAQHCGPFIDFISLSILVLLLLWLFLSRCGDFD